jgi:hypothetical protein
LCEAAGADEQVEDQMTYDIDWHAIPVFICNRNNLDRGFRRLVTWLLSVGMKKIVVIDNKSAYPPLLEYYKDMAGLIEVCVQSYNLGPRGWWAIGEHEKVLTPYIYTDCDVVPSGDCPEDVIEVLLELLRKQETGRKVGVSLRIDNLPDHFSKKDLVIRWESGFWTPDRKEQVNNEYRHDGRAFRADVDTTFAMYHPQQPFTYTGLRTDTPYSFEHVPWYSDDACPTEEDTFYRAHYETAHEGGTMWKTDGGGWALYGWNVRSRKSMEETFRKRGLLEETTIPISS